MGRAVAASWKSGESCERLRRVNCICILYHPTVIYLARGIIAKRENKVYDLTIAIYMQYMLQRRKKSPIRTRTRIQGVPSLDAGEIPRKLIDLKIFALPLSLDNVALVCGRGCGCLGNVTSRCNAGQSIIHKRALVKWSFRK